LALLADPFTLVSRPIPSGGYNCHKISSGQIDRAGTLEIKGNTYRVSDNDPFTPLRSTLPARSTVRSIGFLPDRLESSVSEYVVW